MSEFRQEWPQSPSMNDHLAYMGKGLEVIDQQLVLPSDQRWQIGYGALVMGGQQSSVFGEGMTSTGKSEFGNVVLGERNVIDVDPTDTVGTLEGVESIVDHKFTKRKIKAGDGSDTRLFLDEISHLSSTAPLHKYWTGSEVTLPDGTVLDMRNASIYATANFPGGRSKVLDDAIRARLGINLLSGDGGEAHAKRVSAFVQPELGEEYRDGLLPPVKVRQAMRQFMEAKAPVTDATSSFMVDVISSANGSGLLKPMNLSNKRTLDSWAQAARARRLVDPEAKLEGAISKEEIIGVVALGLGSFAVLNSYAQEQIADSLGLVDVPSHLEKAIFARRALSAVAMNAYINSLDIRVGKDRDAEVANFMNKRSYAMLLEGHSAKADEFIVSTVTGTKSKGEVSNDTQTAKRRFGFRKSR